MITASSSIHSCLLEWLQHGHSSQPRLPADEASQQRVVDDARRHGLTALLVRALEHQHHHIPDEIWRHLKDTAMAIAAKNLALAHELRVVLEACQTQGLICAPLRGLTVADAVYHDLTVRPMGDLDLLARKGDLAALLSVLRGLGYTCVDRRPGFSEEFSYTFECFKEEPVHVIIEPHWTLAYPPYVEQFDMDAVWNRCTSTELLGIQTLRLSPEDRLLNLCLHLAHHAKPPLLWIYELDRLIRGDQESLDWSLLMHTAQAAGVERLLMAALTITHESFHTPLPHHLLQTRPRTTPSQADTVMEASAIEGKESLALLMTLGGLSRKGRYLLGLVFPSAAFMRIHYGVSHWWQLLGAYLQRFWWLSRSVGRACGQILSGSLKRRSS